MKIKVKRFKKYLARIQDLEKKIKSLRNEADQLEDQLVYSESRYSEVSKNLDRQRRAAADREREEELNRWSQEDQLRRYTKDLERYQNYGDQYNISKTIKKINRIF